jgi:DNA-binding MarR family transcriptional regulator
VLRRHIRLAIAFATYRHRRRAERKEPALDLKEVPGLSRDELRVLDLHAHVEPGYALAVSDVAEKLKARGYEVRGALERLRSLELLRSTVTGVYDETAYTLTPAGRALLRAHRVSRA